MRDLIRLFTVCLAPDDGGSGGSSSADDGNTATSTDPGDTDPTGTAEQTSDGQDTTGDNQADEPIKELKQRLDFLKILNQLTKQRA